MRGAKFCGGVGARVPGGKKSVPGGGKPHRIKTRTDPGTGVTVCGRGVDARVCADEETLTGGVGDDPMHMCERCFRLRGLSWVRCAAGNDQDCGGEDAERGKCAAGGE
ncbi:hypothetical protein GCM10027071_21870 [Microbacterium marinum]